MHTAINNIITKTLVQPFYKQHQILLGLVYLIMFGAVRGDQLIQYHIKLIAGTLSSYGAMLLVFSIWIIYFIRTNYFLAQQVRTKEFSLLQQLSLLNTKKYWLTLVKILAICLLPISSYALFIIAWAFANGFIVKGFIVAMLQIALHYWGLLSMHKHLQNAEYYFIKPIYLPSILKFQKKYAFQFYIKYLFSKQALQWLLIKLVCFIAIKAIFHSESPDGELRFSIFLYVLFFMIHTNLIHSFVQWKHTQFWHLRMLPLSAMYKYLQSALFLILLILPEIILISAAYPRHLSTSNTIAMVLLSIATILFIFCISIAFSNNFSDYSPLIGLYLLLCYGCSLANTISAFSIIVIIASCITYVFSIKHFELSPKEK
jgi:hypothetical protein